MKKLNVILPLLFISLFVPRAMAQQWFRYSPTSGFDINAVDILKPGWIVTGGGGYVQGNSLQVMFSSPDYGVTWIENPQDGYANWNNSIAFADTFTGFGVGPGGRIINSGDGGHSWPNVNTVTNRNFNKIICLSPQVYYAVGGQQSNDSIQTIIKSTDGGLVWNVVYDTAGPWLKSVYFINTLNGFAVGDSGVILNTTNGGTTWNPVAAPILRNFEAITFINADTGFIAGGSQALGRSTILQTVNGGITWNVLSDNTGGILNDISFANDTEGYIVGDSATVLKTTNAGGSWSPQLISASLTGSETFRAVKFYDRNFGVIGGRAGALFVYTGWPLDLFTLGPVLLDSADVQVYASINTHSYPEAIHFIYSTDSTFATYQSTAIQSFSSDTFLPLAVQLANLTPNTWYYYFVSAGSRTGDTLRFYTGQAVPVFATKSGAVIDSTSLVLNGEIHGIMPVTSLVFEYGTTPNLGSVIGASPIHINDTADHGITAQLTGVSAATLYYYRLRGVSGTDTLRGDIYFTGSLYHVLETLPPTYVTDTTATLNGAEQGFPGAVVLSFEYWEAKHASAFSTTFPFNTSDTLRAITWGVSGLQPGHFYYYRLKAQSNAGVNFGNIQVFIPGGQDSVLQTLSARHLTYASATLEGGVNYFPDSATLFFEYGTDSSLGTTIPGFPAMVTDSFYHAVSAVLSGVPINTEYYYRLIARLNNNSEIVGAIKQVFIGNEIPNWDFQNWTSQTYHIPTGWNIGTGKFSRVPGHSGNYALNLTGVNIAMLNGFPYSSQYNPGVKILGGIPFTSRPDSFSFYVKTSVGAGDTPTAAIFMRAGNTAIVEQYFALPLNTNGQFERVSYAINYLSPLSPDSMTMAFFTIAPGDSVVPAFNNNSITIDDLAFAPPTTICNGDFETWFDETLDMPDNWWYISFVGLDSTVPVQPIVSKTYFSPPGDYAAEINNLPLGNFGIKEATLGTDTLPLTVDQRPFFAVNKIHSTLNGYYKAFPVNGDTLDIGIYIYSNGVAIGRGQLLITDSATEFTPFEVEIGYANPGYPDGAGIEMYINSGPHVSSQVSHFMVDKLHFDGFVENVADDNQVQSSFDENGIKVYPNPSRNSMTVEVADPTTDESIVQVYSLNGQLEKELRMAQGDQKISFRVNDMSAGFYLLKWVNGTKVINKKIVVMK